jgi:hypothetical protein
VRGVLLIDRAGHNSIQHKERAVEIGSATFKRTVMCLHMLDSCAVELCLSNQLVTCMP